jgi:hypothetical protein
VTGHERSPAGTPTACAPVCLNCTLKRSPEQSNTASLADVVLALRAEGVETDEIRLVDRQIRPGVVP